MTAPSTESTDLEGALAHVSTEDVVWLRVAAVRDADGNWTVGTAELTSGTWPPSWEQRAWQYPDALFIAETLSGQEVAAAVQSGVLELAGFHLTLPQMSTAPRWERRQSWSAAIFEALEWPSTETQLSTLSGVMAEPPGHLLSASDAPSFMSYYAAAAYFFLVDQKPVGGRIQQGVWYRHQDPRGRIDRVRISDESVQVEVEGQDLDGLIVELPGASPGPAVRIWRRINGKPEVVDFPLKDRLPVDSWVLLRRGAEWLDRRFLAFPYARGNEAGVEIVVDRGTRLESLVASRERQTVEFKRQLPRDDETKSKLMKTVCAFANGEGGSLLVGVDDDRNLIGVEEEAIGKMRDQLTQTVRTWVEPWPDSSFEVLPIPDSSKVVLELRVEPGTNLYGSGRPGETRTVYVRHHGITERATPAEIESIVRSRAPVASPYIPSVYH